MLNNALLAAGSAQELVIHPWLILPFVLLLLSIALIPLINSKWWEKYYWLVSVGLGAFVLCYYLFIFKAPVKMLHVAHEYISFIVLIGSLFVVSGGIHISTKGQAKPLINCIFLFAGSILANLVGTTGASMLMIRPWIRMNRRRITGFHIVFFIFIVSNIAGVLTPIGDPPLFLGFLRGVPFWWTLEHCWMGWLIAVLLVLAIFYVIDLLNYRKAMRHMKEIPNDEDEKISVTGLPNLFFLLMILCAVFIEKPLFLRESLMVLAAVGSYLTTSRQVHERNDFTFGPIKEVAWLFAGIFLTMTPALAYLGTHAESFGIDSPIKFFWCTGILSGFLDNAPTYLTFLATAMGLYDMDVGSKQEVLAFVGEHGYHLIAISLGAVFFGAMTYIGNGPNFMVKSIADRAGIHMPTFFGYLLKYSIPILIPVFLLITILFFSPWAIF